MISILSLITYYFNFFLGVWGSFETHQIQSVQLSRSCSTMFVVLRQDPTIGGSFRFLIISPWSIRTAYSIWRQVIFPCYCTLYQFFWTKLAGPFLFHNTRIYYASYSEGLTCLWITNCSCGQFFFSSCIITWGSPFTPCRASSSFQLVCCIRYVINHFIF